MSRRDRVTLALAAAREALNAGAATVASTDHLGDLVWWDPSQGWRKPCADVDAAWRAAGLDPAADLPSHTDWSTAFGRSINSVRSSIHPQAYTLKDAAPDQGARRVAIVRESRNGKYTSEDQGTIQLPAGDLSPWIERIETNMAQGIADTVLSETRAHYDHYTADDIRTAITKTIERWAGLPCRQCPPHVVYWLPAPAANAIRRLADVVELLGWGSIQLVAAHRSDARSVKAAESAVSQGLEVQLSAFAKDAEAYAQGNHAKTRPSTIEARLTEAKALRERGDLYRAILGAAVSSVDTRIAAIESSLRDTLSLVMSANG
jgi:hypothetical protein